MFSLWLIKNLLDEIYFCYKLNDKYIVVRKELGKWLLDIAKYLVTAVLLASVFGDIEDKWIVYVVASFTIIITLGFGLYLVQDKKKKGEYYGSNNYVCFGIGYRYCWRSVFLYTRQERNQDVMDKRFINDKDDYYGSHPFFVFNYQIKIGCTLRCTRFCYE